MKMISRKLNFILLSFLIVTVPNLSFAAPECELISRGPGVDLVKSEVLLHTFLQGFMKALSGEKFEDFSSYFHPRAKVSRDIGERIESLLNNRYDKRWEFSVYRVWRIRGNGTNKAILDNCAEADGAKIISTFGFEPQFAVWIQLLGQNELGRLILSIGQDKGKVSIVGFRIQQWTQLGNDANAWIQKADAATNPVQEYFAIDIASKLLEGADLVIYPQQANLLKRRDRIFSQQALVKKMNDDLKTDTIAYIGSLMTREETGILLREIVTGQEDSKKLADLCKKHGKDLLNIGWLLPKQSLRCNFILKSMNPHQDSSLGGQIFTSVDLQKK